MFDARRMSGLIVQKQNESLISNDFFKTVTDDLSTSPNYEDSLYVDKTTLKVPTLTSDETMMGLFCSKDIKQGDIISLMNEKSEQYNDGLMNIKSLMDCNTSNEFYTKAILLREYYTNPENVKNHVNVTMITDANRNIYLAAYKDIPSGTEIVGYYSWDMWVQLMMDIVNPINFVGYYCLVRDASLMATNDSKIKILLKVLPKCINSENIEALQNTLEILNLYDNVMAKIENKDNLKDSMRDIIISYLIEEINSTSSQLPEMSSSETRSDEELMKDLNKLE